MLHFTRQERLVLIYIAVVIWIGSLTQIVIKTSPGLRQWLDCPMNFSRQVKVDINSADTIELEKIPYIGHKTAQEIIQYRIKSGGFKTMDDLLLVHGIRTKKLELIKPYITLKSNMIP